MITIAHQHQDTFALSPFSLESALSSFAFSQPLLHQGTVQEKAHSQENDLICWHFDHTVNRSVKGINLLNCLYHANDTSLPVAFEVVTKPIRFCDVKTQKEKRQSATTKNEQLRNMLSVCRQNQLKWRYVLADSWFSSS